MKNSTGGMPHYLGRVLLLVVIAVFVCVLVRLGQELTAVVMALGSISATVFALSAHQQPASSRGAGA
ncbi:hypothetical protein HUT17_05220 (plasmid) [Nocardiopsis flavescens]|nr:hypothetical protein HUT17_05220 [Nocardiopsis flavescens]